MTGGEAFHKPFLRQCPRECAPRRTPARPVGGRSPPWVRGTAWEGVGEETRWRGGAEAHAPTRAAATCAPCPEDAVRQACGQVPQVRQEGELAILICAPARASLRPAAARRSSPWPGRTPWPWTARCRPAPAARSWHTACRGASGSGLAAGACRGTRPGRAPGGTRLRLARPLG